MTIIIQQFPNIIKLDVEDDWADVQKNVYIQWIKNNNNNNNYDGSYFSSKYNCEW